MSYSEMNAEGSDHYLDAPMIDLSYNVHIQSPDFHLFQNWNQFNYS